MSSRPKNKRKGLTLPFVFSIDGVIRLGCCLQQRKFAFSARRSTSLLVRRRARESRSEAKLPCHSDQKAPRNGSSVPWGFFDWRVNSAWLLPRNNASSYTLPEDLQARLQGAGRGYHEAKRSYLVTPTNRQCLHPISGVVTACLLFITRWQGLL